MFGDRPGWLDRIVKPPDPRELVRKWQSDLRKESRQLERTIWNIQREEKAAHKNVKEAAKRGDMASAKVRVFSFDICCCCCFSRCSSWCSWAGTC